MASGPLMRLWLIASNSSVTVTYYHLTQLLINARFFATSGLSN